VLPNLYHRVWKFLRGHRSNLFGPNPRLGLWNFAVCFQYVADISGSMRAALAYDPARGAANRGSSGVESHTLCRCSIFNALRTFLVASCYIRSCWPSGGARTCVRIVARSAGPSQNRIETKGFISISCQRRRKSETKIKNVAKKPQNQENARGAMIAPPARFVRLGFSTG
jgi:hypothetical protein